MKPIRLTKQFKKNFQKRIANNPKLLSQFQNRTDLFQQGERGQPLNDHSLTAKLAGLRSFSITGDIRVVYQDSEECYRFIDVGSHNQVYR